MKELQKECPHKNTEWAEEWWAPGHSTGYDIQVCKRCRKIIERRKYEEVK